MKDIILSRIAVAILSALVSALALEWPVITKDVCFNFLNSSDLTGHDFIDELHALPVFPITYYETLEEEE